MTLYNALFDLGAVALLGLCIWVREKIQRR